ncbi:efflux RND transporter periplasmic adaptor subunit [Rheinheimera texasensis]|jgi:multidrug efflux system membrane fusion protein|uniref:efflux RND transporter periplasmic adaptor subunit n=1 Tax=Rheinheimera texasensis TaxID=306205 RepID=UPI00069222D2|nr:efflux RND transporter periplasmic adaptor subunit [Rheinheimera texasensis]
MQVKWLVSGAVLLAAAGMGGYWWQQQDEAAPAGAAQTAGAQAGQRPGGPQAGGPQSGQRPAGAGPRRAGGPGGPGGGANPWNAPVPVRVISAETTDLKVQFKTIGTATALNTVLVQPRVSGPLLALHFTEGQKVEAGQLLAEIDPAPYQVKLAQAEGQLQQNVAQLKNAELDLALYEKLKTQNSISRQQYNTQQALVNQLKGSLKSNQAQIDAAKLELSYTRIVAPISGKTGLRKVDAGNLVQANSAEGLVSITQSAPIYVVFSIPETQLQSLRLAVQDQQKQQQKLVVEAWDRNDKQLLATGELTTLDNQIDPATGTLKLKAQFANSDDQLFPNQFVNVRLNIASRPGAVTIPQDAVQYGADGTFIYVVENKKAQLKMLELGVVDNGRVEVRSGLKGGDQIVMEGLDRLRPGRDVELVQSSQQE